MTQAVDDELTVVITSPDKVVWEGRATSVTSENSEGPFDVLAGHAKFVTMIKGKPITARGTAEGEKVFNYKNAVLSVIDNKVSIYCDI